MAARLGSLDLRVQPSPDRARRRRRVSPSCRPQSISAAPLTLDPETIEAIAERAAKRTVELLRADDDVSAGHRLVSAAEVAHELNVSRQWVYEHAEELGARRLGDGPRPRLRFDLETARDAMSRYAGNHSQGSNASTGAESVAPPARGRRRLPNHLPKPGSVLAVRPRNTADTPISGPGRSSNAGASP